MKYLLDNEFYEDCEKVKKVSKKYKETLDES
jgi:hypothetical protein